MDHHFRNRRRTYPTFDHGFDHLAGAQNQHHIQLIDRDAPLLQGLLKYLLSPGSGFAHHPSRFGQFRQRDFSQLVPGMGLADDDLQPIAVDGSFDQTGAQSWLDGSGDQPEVKQSRGGAFTDLFGIS